MVRNSRTPYVRTMTQSPAYLEDRVVLSVDGPDAETFLQGLITNNSTGMTTGNARYGALLSPQGKIISDMILLRTDTGFFLDVPIQADEALLKRLQMFKLRADVAVSLRDDLSVMAFDDSRSATSYDDPRSENLPRRIIRQRDKTDEQSKHAWHTARIAAGIPQQGMDFGENEVFPADVNMDINHGIDFKKGCFVGQEVVSRMKRRGTARRRTLLFKFDRTAPERGARMMVGEISIGEVTSNEGSLALARVRIDRMAKAMAENGEAFIAENRNAALLKSDWLDSELAALAAAKNG